MNLRASDPGACAHNLCDTLSQEREPDSWPPGNQSPGAFAERHPDHSLCGTCFSQLLPRLCSPAADSSLTPDHSGDHASSGGTGPSTSSVHECPTSQKPRGALSWALLCLPSGAVSRPTCSIWAKPPLPVRSAVSAQPRQACLDHSLVYNLTF